MFMYVHLHHPNIFFCLMAYQAQYWARRSDFGAAMEATGFGTNKSHYIDYIDLSSTVYPMRCC